jgi:hypothetical protein
MRQFIVHSQTTLFIMSNLLYIIAVILIIGWLIGVFAYSVGGIIHILLVLAIIAILFNIISGRRRVL